MPARICKDGSLNGTIDAQRSATVTEKIIEDMND